MKEFEILEHLQYSYQMGKISRQIGVFVWSLCSHFVCFIMLLLII